MTPQAHQEGHLAESSSDSADASRTSGASGDADGVGIAW